MTRSGVVAVACALALAPLPAAAADRSADPGFDRQIQVWTRTLDRLDGLEDGDPSRAEIDAAHAEALEVGDAAEAARARIEGRLAPISDELAALGPRPAEGEAAEAADVAALRRQLERQQTAISARLKRTDVVIARVDAIRQELRRLRRAALAERLLRRGPPPLDPATWRPAAASLGALAATAAAELGAWRAAGLPPSRGAQTVLWIALLVLVAIVVAGAARRWLVHTFGRDPDVAAPEPARRLVAAVAEATGESLVLCLPAVVLAGTLVDLDLATGRAAALAEAAAVGLVVLVTVTALARAALPPGAPAWGLVPFDDDATRTARRRVGALALLLAAIGFVRRAADGLEPAPELESMLAVAVTLPLAAILMPLASRRVWRARGAESERWWTRRLLHLAVAVVVVAMPITALAGWPRLAFAINRALIVAGLVGVGLVAVRTLVGALVELAARREHPAAAGTAVDTGVVFWLRLAADVVLVPCAALVWLTAVGAPLPLVLAGAGRALRTIEIGSIRISLADVVFAVAGFAAIVAATRLLHRALEQRILPRTDLALGTQQALATAASYAGLALATTVAIATLGLDLSSLALIAGALSVGIGFGLQNVVNNFVSGIIMLVERPIKVGDWVVIGTHEGTVKRINVRATEVETFQRSAVLIPNSEVLSSAVVNWTHRDKHGRCDLAVGVAYGSDVEKVRTVLLACARAHARVVSIPAPYVLFRDFGDSALLFELRAYLANVEERLLVMSDLRFAIDAAFRRQGIEIPFAQHDLHLRDLDRLERALAGRGAGDGTPAAADAAPARTGAGDPEPKDG